MIRVSVVLKYIPTPNLENPVSGGRSVVKRLDVGVSKMIENRHSPFGMWI
jgi:hypothetical protein